MNKGVVTRDQLDALKADVDAKQAQLNTDQDLLNRRTITAPFEGQLKDFMIHPGDYVTAGQPLVTLINSSQLKIAYALNQNYLKDIAIGNKVEIIPEESILASLAGNYVFVVNATNHAERRNIQEGIHQHNQVQILSGLAPHDRVVIEGQQKLSDGQLVHIDSDQGSTQ
jgi:membrane fusion protein (multidrug efflux system)